MKKHTTTQPLVADEKIIDMYWERNPDAIQETDKKMVLCSKTLRTTFSVILWIVKNAKMTHILKSGYNPFYQANCVSSFYYSDYETDLYRSLQKKSSQKRIPSQLITSIQELEQSITSGPAIEEIYEAEEIGKMVSDYVGSLNDRQRYIFVDRFYMAESVEKIASDLSIPVKTAYWEIGRIKQGLKEYLQGQGVSV